MGYRLLKGVGYCDLGSSCPIGDAKNQYGGTCCAKCSHSVSCSRFGACRQHCPKGATCPRLGSWGVSNLSGLTGSLGADSSLAELQQKRESIKSSLDSVKRERALLAKRMSELKIPILGTQLIPQSIIDFVSGKSGKLPDWMRSKILLVPGGAAFLREAESLISKFNDLQKQLALLDEVIRNYVEKKPVPPPTTTPTTADKPWITPYLLPSIVRETLAPTRYSIQLEPDDAPLDDDAPKKRGEAKGIPLWAWPLGAALILGGGFAYKKFSG